MNATPRSKCHEEVIQLLKKEYVLNDSDIESEEHSFYDAIAVSVKIPKYNEFLCWSEVFTESEERHSWFDGQNFVMDEFLRKIRESVSESSPFLAERHKCYKKFEREISELQKEISLLRERNSVLEEEKAHLLYRPGGEGAKEAEIHFESLKAQIYISE
uniref:Uncharacterized protein n=1 Tax=Marseillevirus sp. TaxID=2809551 RepID=A0AA96ER63_9VIRU|nr:hypothetical protein MarFTMF_101 [Marseillevirus sp.]